MRDLLDSHTHTLVSGHAYNTMNEMIAAAKERGLLLLAITEHAPAMPGTCTEMHFNNLRILPRRRDGLITLFGVEANILDCEGHLDMPEESLRAMDVVIASIHPPTFRPKAGQDQTQTYRAVMENPYVHIIGHPEDGRYPVDFDALARMAKKAHKLLELNNASLQPTSYRKNGRENYKEMLRCCRKYEVPVILDSDAHMDLLVGEHSRVWQLVQESGFPEELIVNTNLDQYFSFISPKAYERVQDRPCR